MRISGLAAIGLLATAGSAVAADAVCHRPETLMQDVYAGEPGAARFAWTGADASAIETTLAAEIRHGFAADAAGITLVVDYGRGTAVFYLYGGDGCYFWQVLSSPERAAELLDAAGIPPPPPAAPEVRA